MNIEKVTELVNQWYAENAPLGRSLGYPECCITAFCAQPPEILKITKATDIDRARFKAGCINGKYTGFIPCASHAKEIMAGKITLASLIKKRDSKFPAFPDFAPYNQIKKT